MKRVHLFELEDQHWWPSRLRDYMTDTLAHQIATVKMYAAIVPKLAEALRRSEQRQVIDLCSGGGSSVPVLVEAAAASDVAIDIVISDKYPNFGRFEQVVAAHDNCRYIAESIDACAVPAHVRGFRTLFTAFHHFRPEDARRILQNAVDADEPIAIFEFTERSLRFVLGDIFIGPFALLAVTPRVRPRTLGRLLLTYVLPVLPLALVWDGLVSGLRTYEPDELAGLVGELEGGERFEWDIGRLDSRVPFGFRTTYLIGLPRRS